jgi:quercetin dioxygenase-like cupin family protein
VLSVPGRDEIDGEEDDVRAVSVAESHPKRVIVNPVSGETIVIQTSGAETGGRLLVFDLFLPPATHVPARHVHPIQTEQFTVLAGRIRFRLGRQTILAEPSDTVLVPAGTSHWFGNAGPGPAHVRVEVRPALRMEELLEASAAMTVGVGFFGRRLPRLTDLARLLVEFQRELAVPDVPPVVSRAALALFAWLGQRRARRGAT